MLRNIGSPRCDKKSERRRRRSERRIRGAGEVRSAINIGNTRMKEDSWGVGTRL
jgi:hypothetical protein